MSDLRLTVLMVRPSDQVYFGPCVGGLQIADQALKGQGQPSHRFFAIDSRLPRPPSASRDVRDLPWRQPAGRPSYAASLLWNQQQLRGLGIVRCGLTALD